MVIGCRILGLDNAYRITDIGRLLFELDDIAMCDGAAYCIKDIPRFKGLSSGDVDDLLVALQLCIFVHLANCVGC